MSEQLSEGKKYTESMGGNAQVNASGRCRNLDHPTLSWRHDNGSIFTDTKRKFSAITYNNAYQLPTIGLAKKPHAFFRPPVQNHLLPYGLTKIAKQFVSLAFKK